MGVDRFEFGKNWESFSRSIDDESIRRAEDRLANLLGTRDLSGRMFLDIGCGSGLHSLAALRFGAAQVTAIDLDPNSVATTQAVLGKFLAAWAFCAIAVALTFPLWVTVNLLGSPDNGVILSGYVGALLVAGAFLAMGAAVSALTRNQVIAFVLAVVLCFVFAVAGTPVVTEFLSSRTPLLAEAARAISVFERFNGFVRGVVALRDLVFFGSLIAFFLFVNVVVLDHRKAD